MGKMLELNISFMTDVSREVVRKKSRIFTIAQLISLAAIVLGLLVLPSVARATDRLTDKEVVGLFDSVEKDRSTFEAALDQQMKNSIIKGAKGEVHANEFLDDLQDQLTKIHERFKPDYSASSEVLALLEYTTRLDRWVKKQPAGFKGAAEWGPFNTDLQRVAAAYNTTMPIAANGYARRYNDSELVTCAANVEKLVDPFRHELEVQLTADKKMTPEKRQDVLQQVDNLKTKAHMLNDALAKPDKGIAEADALIKQALLVTAWVSKNKLGSAASAAWTPLRVELGKVALAYEVNNKSLAIQ